ncbi:MAG: PaaI family thioesterase [Firmicutes bacterium]|nr:PaaI family thioesterase [Bacillota bacterium]
MMERFLKDNPFWQWMGFAIDTDAAAEGKAVVTVPVRPEFRQHQGLVHGGVMSALIDSAGAWGFALTHQEALRTINMSVQYLSPVVPETPQLRAEATVIRAGRRIVIVEVRVWGMADVLAAQGQVIYSRAHA